jgi:hypothetical protein
VSSTGVGPEHNRLFRQREIPSNQWFFASDYCSRTEASSGFQLADIRPYLKHCEGAKLG